MDSAARLAAVIWAKLGDAAADFAANATTLGGALPWASPGAAAAAATTYSLSPSPPPSGAPRVETSQGAFAAASTVGGSAEQDHEGHASSVAAAAAAAALHAHPLLAPPPHAPPAAASASSPLYVPDIGDSIWDLPHVGWDAFRFAVASLVEAVALAAGVLVALRWGAVLSRSRLRIDPATGLPRIPAPRSRRFDDGRGG